MTKLSEWKKNRPVSQTIEVICATCGKPTKINNRHEETAFVLIGDELLFDCPHCKYVYDVPVRKQD